MPAGTETRPTILPQPPGPRGHGIRNLLKRVRDTTGMFEELRNRYGDIVMYRLLWKRFCVIFDPGMSEEVVIAQRAHFEKGTEQKKLLDICIITADGEEHRRRRKLVQPSFTPKAIEGYADQMVGEAVRVQETWSEGQTIDIDDVASQLSLAVAARTFFGDDIAVRAKTVHDSLAGYRWNALVGLLPFSGFFKSLPLPRNRKARRAIQRLDAAIMDAVRRARANAERTDLIAHLVHARDEEGMFSPFTDKELRNEAFAILITGHHTIATTLTFALYYLSRNPPVRERVEREIDDVLGTRLPSFEDFNKLSYTRAVVDETLRITPPTGYLGRTALEDVTIANYRIPRGTVVQPSIRVPMREEKFFAEPERFIPERWMEVPQPKRPRFAYAPFGTGDRFCSGFRFALLELVLSLAIFCQRWRIDVIQDEFPAVIDLVIYRCKDGLPVRVRRRTARHPRGRR